MYRLLIIAEEDGERTMLSIGGTRDSFSKDLLEKAKRDKEEAK